MKTVEWKGITLTVAPTDVNSCQVRIKGHGQIDCFLKRASPIVCAPMCPGSVGVLLEGDDLAKYLAAKLTGDLG